ncbi:MAG: SMP-30/gluconolactonase/LRE family protein [Planctomycetota bacterium]|nr:SMP-30/gluconolactonase/LRE family protein [Planctomycetota bacterium]
MQIYQTSVLLDPECRQLRFLPEGPIAYGNQGFSWVAIQHAEEATHGSLNVFDWRSRSNSNYELPGRPGFAFPTEIDEIFVAGLERRVMMVNIATGESTVISDEIDQVVENTIINDGIPFSEGIIFGAKDLEFQTKKAGLYFWRASDRNLMLLRDDQICSNGKIITGVGNTRTLLDIDTPTQQVVRYELDCDAGILSDPEVVLDLSALDIFPDGMVATPDGQSVIIAFYNPNPAEYGVARQFSLATGNVEAEWRCAQAPRVTCPLLLNTEDGVKLILTTATEVMESAMFEAHPNSGCLFVSDTLFDLAPVDYRFTAEQLGI